MSSNVSNVSRASRASNASAPIYEHDPISSLKSDSAVHINVPESVITDDGMGTKRVSAFAYFYIRRGLDNKLDFNVNRLVEWCGRKPDGRAGRVNDAFSDAVMALSEKGYLSIDGRPKNSRLSEAEFDKQKVANECEGGDFAVLYLDEMRKIFDYGGGDADDFSVHRDAVVLVFAYLRMMIRRRPNKLKPDEIGLSRFELSDKRRKGLPEVYDCHHRDIAEKVGLSDRSVSKAIGVLADIGLIYSEALPREKNEDGEWKTTPTMFCNFYKREKSNLLATGESYYRPEIKAKKERVAELKRKKRR